MRRRWGRWRLDELGEGRCGAVARVEAEDDATDRMKVMGVCVGRKVEVIRHGHPLILRVLGSRVGLSRRLARRVWVEPCAATGCVQ